MRLNICLINDHEPIPVTHLIKLWRIRIMTRTDCIKVVLFHQRKIFAVLPDINHKSCFRIRIMAVHPAQLNLLPIEVKDAVFDSNRAKSNRIRNHLIICF